MSKGFRPGLEEAGYVGSGLYIARPTDGSTKTYVVSREKLFYGQLGKMALKYAYLESVRFFYFTLIMEHKIESSKMM